jgi:hypothetical protein
MRLSNAAASACAGDGTNKGLAALLGSAPVLNVYAGGVNASAESAPSGTLIGAVTLAAFGTATNGATASTGGTATAGNAGTAGCWQLLGTGSAIIADGTIALTTGGDINVTGSLSVLVGETLTIGTVTLTIPPH